jgi:hypothetical protein
MVMIGLLGPLGPASAGIYSSIDPREEMRYSQEYEVFGKVLDVLSTIGVPKPATNPPIRQRYVLIEALGRDGMVKLDTLEQKINYSAVLIRRGRALEAVQFLRNVYEENRDNFVVTSQFATAHFLTGNPDFEGASLRYMKRALDKWPKTWADLNDEQKKFLKIMGWEENIDFDRYRRCEEHLQRLIANRLHEKKLRAEKKPFDETVDPIFLDAKDQPIRFVNDEGKFEAGKIAAAAKEALRRDCVEDVEQLLIWMPNDQRLLWLLAETLNASAMDYKDKKDKNRVIENAHKILLRLTRFDTPMEFGRREVKEREQVLQTFVEANPTGELPPDIVKEDLVPVSSARWWATVAFIVGLAIGMFAIWQIQEMRRRRLARAAARN